MSYVLLIYKVSLIFYNCFPVTVPSDLDLGGNLWRTILHLLLATSLEGQWPWTSSYVTPQYVSHSLGGRQMARPLASTYRRPGGNFSSVCVYTYRHTYICIFFFHFTQILSKLSHSFLRLAAGLSWLFVIHFTLVRGSSFL